MKMILQMVGLMALGMMVACGGGESGSSADAPGKTIEQHRAEAKAQINDGNAEDELKKLEQELNAPDPVIE